VLDPAENHRNRFRCKRTNRHTGEICNDDFQGPGDLAQHEDVFHDPRRQAVRCHLCDEERTLGRDFELKRHLRIVHAELVFLPENSRSSLEQLKSHSLRYELLFRAQAQYRFRTMNIFARLGLLGDDVEDLNQIIAKPDEFTEHDSAVAFSGVSLLPEAEENFPAMTRKFSAIEERVENLVRTLRAVEL